MCINDGDHQHAEQVMAADMIVFKFYAPIGCGILVGYWCMIWSMNYVSVPPLSTRLLCDRCVPNALRGLVYR
jgi:hypothetical protein